VWIEPVIAQVMMTFWLLAIFPPKDALSVLPERKLDRRVTL
jgi:hypothetical protein